MSARFKRFPPSIHVPVDASWKGLLDALNQELRERRGVRITIDEVVSRNGDSCVLRLDSPSVPALKEDHEDWHAQHGNPATGKCVWEGKVQHVDVDHASIGLTFDEKTVLPPTPFDLQLLEPDYQFLLRLLAARHAKEGAPLPTVLTDLAAGRHPKRSTDLSKVAGSDPLLRSAQIAAVRATGQSFAVVWGPPGTGKTFTLGASVRALVASGRRALVLAPTNAAIDQAVLSIDDAFTRAGSPLLHGQLLRPGRPKNAVLETRKHLLAWNDVLRDDSRQIGALRRNVADLQRKANTSRGKERDRLNGQLSIAKGLLEAAERRRSSRLWALIQNAHVIATTLVSALHQPGVMEWAKDDGRALFIDEASMVSRAALVAFLEARFDHLVLFGDPRQLGPIVRAKNKADENARYWIGDSIFDHVGASDDASLETLEKQGRLVMLTEQSRMHDQLCRPVSDTFYMGRLKTTGKTLRPPLAPGWPDAGVAIVDPLACPLPGFAPSMVSRALDKRENKCEWAGWVAARLIGEALAAAPTTGILAVSPFRGQADLMRKIIRTHFSYHEKVVAGTIHTSQGAEAELVIFDPVNPRHAWLLGHWGGDDMRRLLCVAFSRSRVTIVVLGRRDSIMTNPLLARLCAEAVDWVLP